MTEHKLYLEEASGKIEEIRRRYLPNYCTIKDLHKEIQRIFPKLVNQKYKIEWKDSQNDRITMVDDDDFQVFMSLKPFRPSTFYIKQYPETQNSQPTKSKQPRHIGVICDYCDSTIAGCRYKCVTCENYDLCSTCESLSNHDHVMIRMPTPLDLCAPAGRQLLHLMRKFFKRQHEDHCKHRFEDCLIQNLLGSEDKVLNIHIETDSKEMSPVDDWTIVNKSDAAEMVGNEASVPEVPVASIVVTSQENSSSLKTASTAKENSSSLQTASEATANSTEKPVSLPTERSPEQSSSTSNENLSGENTEGENLSAQVVLGAEQIYPQLPNEEKIHHPDPIIDKAIKDMISMGFSNENGVLTYLLIKLKGNINQALDIMTKK